MITHTHARTLAVVLVLAVVALGLLASRSARRVDTAPVLSAAVANTSAAGASAHQRHLDRVALGR